MSIFFIVNSIIILILKLYFQIMQKVSELDINRQDILMQCLVVRQGDIQNALLQGKLAISGPTLQDFDWKIKACEVHLKQLVYLFE